MRRWGIRILICVLLGAVTNVAVAWGLVVAVMRWGYWPPVEQDRETLSERAGFTRFVWKVSRDRQIGIQVLNSYRKWHPWKEDYFAKGSPEALIPRWLDLDRPTAAFENRLAEFESHQVRAFGWPLLTLWHSYVLVNYPPFGQEGWSIDLDDFELRGGLTVEEYALPLRPIWPGFAINTVFYAAILLGLWMTPLTIRRMVRAKRGRCDGCGYDLRGVDHERCPECGEEPPTMHT